MQRWTRDLVKDVAIVVENVKRARSIVLESILGSRDIEDQSYTGTVPWLSHQIQFEVYMTTISPICRSLSTNYDRRESKSNGRIGWKHTISNTLAHWEDSHRFWLCACTTRYVRDWQCHSRNILEEKPFVDPFSETQNACTYRRKRESKGKIAGSKI